MMKMKKSPCENCRKVLLPSACDNKECGLWRAWFLERWAMIYGYGQSVQQKEQP